MGMTLYVGSKNLSSWSMRPYLALAHSGAPFEDVVIELDQSDTKAKILAVNPAGRVPVLVHDGLAIWDSLAICEYVAELQPQAGLWPADRAERARARSVAAEMHSGFTGLRTNMPMNITARKPGVGHTADALADAARVMAIWRELRAAPGVAARGPFLFGTFTIADAMFAPVTTRFVTYGVEVDATAKAYIDAVAAHPAMQAWCAAAAAATTSAR